MAIKIILKEEIDFSNKKNYILSCIKRETGYIRLCKCENVLELYDSFEINDVFILSFELSDNNLLDFVKNNPKYRSNLHFIRNTFIELNNAFKILSEKKIIHRDIKHENILLKFEKNKIIPKLGDFGISRN